MRRYRLELLLFLAVLALFGQLAWPSVAHWWHRPGPGRVGMDEFEPSCGLAGGYAVYLPVGYNKHEQSWPLVVFLHGSGENGNDPMMIRGVGPLAVVQNEAALPAIVVAPQCLPSSGWDPESVVRFIEHVALRYRVDAERIYLVGYSMGGYGTWRTASAHPELFAGIVPISGGGDPNEAKRSAGIPIWAFHGAKDEAVPVAESECMVNAIRAAGGNPRFTILHDKGHGICDSTCLRSDLWEWLLTQQRPTQGQR